MRTALAKEILYLRKELLNETPKQRDGEVTLNGAAVSTMTAFTMNLMSFTLREARVRTVEFSGFGLFPAFTEKANT